MNVQDILRLPSMKEAKIIAGESQSQCLVTTITVLEVSEPSLYSQMPIKESIRETNWFLHHLLKLRKI